MPVVEYQESKVVFNGNVNENEVMALRTFLQQHKESMLTFDFANCNDVHTAVLQLILAFKLLYQSEFVFDAQYLPYRMAIEGFKADENDFD